MMEKSAPQLSTAEITRAFPGQVVFLGDKEVFTVNRAFGTKSAGAQLEALFTMKPGEVKEMPAEELRSLGAQTILARMIEVIPGKVADLNEPKTKEKLHLATALRRSIPWQQQLSQLWNAANFWSEDPADKQVIEGMFFPDRAAAATPKQ